MIRNRIFFMTVWFCLSILLFLMPGFEMRGFSAGMIVGYLPFLALSWFHLVPEHKYPLLVLICMFLFSGGFVLLTAWLMDRKKAFAVNLCILLITIPICTGFWNVNSNGYEHWRRSAYIQQTMTSPAVRFRPTRGEYNRRVVYPRFLSSCLIGLYLACLIGGAVAGDAVLFRKKTDGGAEREKFF